MKLPGAKDYPKEVHIGDETYTIRFVSKITPGGKKCVGLCDPSSRIIYLRKGLSKSQLFRTFIHECLHAAEFELEIPVPHKMVYQLEKAIADFIMVNF